MNSKKRIAIGIIIGLVLFQAVLAYSFLNGIPEETVPDPKIYFCPKDDCSLYLVSRINKAKESVHCAFFDLDLENVITALKKVDAKLIVDDNNFKGLRDMARKDNSKQLMHNKFCIIDGKTVITGSFNPTTNGNNFNNNNMIIMESKYLAKNYEDEFNELWNGKFSGGKKVKYQEVYLNVKKYENYFCPEDNCEENVLKVLKTAKESIHFMTFSFTSEDIGNFLVKNKHLEIKGIFEKFQSGKFSQFNKLKENGIDVKYDNNPKNMHHKVFIIDEEIVILGSYNPTKSGDSKNDENILIIHDKKIAKKFMEEFGRLW